MASNINLRRLLGFTCIMIGSNYLYKNVIMWKQKKIKYKFKYGLCVFFNIQGYKTFPVVFILNFTN